MMMNFKSKIILAVFFISIFSISILWASELNFPLPAGVMKIRGEKAQFGPIKATTYTYKTILNREQINLFYDKEMVLSGWSRQAAGVFVKNKYLAVVSPHSLGGQNKENKFTITISSIPTKKEVLASYSAKPEKVKFMPIYPGSIQSISLKVSDGATSSYETDDSINEVVFFYESGMLKYGWSLVSRIPVTGIADRVVLLFGRQNGETCRIQISSAFSKLSGMLIKEKSIDKIDEKKSNITSILVNYNAYGKNKP